MLVIPVMGANQWRAGTGADSIIGSTNISDIDAASFQNITDPAERLLSNYKRSCRVEYLSAATLTVTAGELTLQNSDGSVMLYQQNTSSVTVTWADIDTGAEANSTTYYVWGFQETVTDSDFDVTISTSSSAPSGKTNYAKLGSFYNNGSGDIEQITNDSTDLNQDARIKGWINFDGTGTISISDNYNVSSITDNGTGDYTIIWDTDFANANYAVAGMNGVSAFLCFDTSSPMAAGSVNVNSFTDAGNKNDNSVITVIAIGDQ